MERLWLFLLLVQAPDGASWLVQAQRHFQQQQWEDSRKAALKALEVDPKLGDAYVLLGLVATARSQFNEAETRFEKAVALQPKNPRAHAYLGSTYLQQKRYDEARRSFEQVLKLDPSNLPAQYNLGLIGLAVNRPADALPHFDRVHRAQTSDVGALIGMLESQLLLKRLREAKESASKAASLLDSRDPRLFQVATLLAFHGEYAAAIPLLERVREVHRDSYDVNYNLALALFRSAQYERSAEVLVPLLSGARPAEAYNLLGAVEEKRGRISEAVAALKKAAGLNPGKESFRFDYAAALLLYGDLNDAVSAFDAASRDFPASVRVRVGAGAAQYLAGHYEPAVRALLEAVRIDPDARSAYRLLGLSYETAPALQAEIAGAFAAYLKRRDDDSWAHYYYGAMLDGDTGQGASEKGDRA